MLLINDGIHRVYAARKRGRKLNVVIARNVPREYPYYAYALPEGWTQVEELSELTEGYQKKVYRNPENYKALFRDFNEIFEGIQNQRPKTNPRPPESLIADAHIQRLGDWFTVQFESQGNRFARWNSRNHNVELV